MPQHNDPTRLEKWVQSLEKELGFPLTPEAKAKILAILSEQQIRAQTSQSEPKPKKQEEEFVRFSLNIRIQHAVLAVSVLLLIFTGLPLKYHEAAWAEFVMRLFGGISVTRVLHRIAAALLTGVGIYHLFWILGTRAGRRELWYLLPRWKDFKDFYQNIRYFLGFTEERPKFDRYSYIEKFDYWAVYWGMVIMIGSGIILSFFPYLVQVLPKYVFDIAREMHSDEALLATLAIVIWHWYNAHFNPDVFPMNFTIFTGKIPKERMIHEHYWEYVRILQQRERQQSSTTNLQDQTLSMEKGADS